MEIILSDRQMSVQEFVAKFFGLDLMPVEAIARQIPISRSAVMTVFLAQDDKLYALIQAKSKTVLADIAKMLHASGVVPEAYFPPINQPHYFEQFAIKKYQQTYPGLKPTKNSDLDFYRTLAPYNPGLVEIRLIKDGKIKTFDADVKGGWRTYCKFNYSKIEISALD